MARRRSLLLVAAAAVLPLLRQRGNPSWDSLWAEDGFLLYQDVLDDGPLGALLRTYNGYLVLGPRLLAAPLAWVPPGRAAAYCALAATASTAVLAALVHRWTAGWIASAAARLALATLVVLMPAAGLENTAVVANTLWVLVCATPWAVLARQHGRLDVAARGTVLFLAATSTPVALLALPPALLWTWRERRRTGMLVVTGAFLAGALVQGVAIALTDQELVPVNPKRPADEVATLLLVRLFGVALVGPEQAVRLWADHGLLPAVVAAVLVVALLAALARGARRRDRALGLAFAGAGLAVLFALVWSRGTLPWRFGAEFDPLAHMRYSVPAVFLLASGVAVLAGNPPAGGGAPGRWRRRSAQLFAAHTALVVVLCFPTVGYRGLGPTWHGHLRVAAGQCRAPAQPDEVVVAQDANPFWGVRIACDRLR